MIGLRLLTTNLKGIYNTLKPVDASTCMSAGMGAFVCISSISGARGNLGQTILCQHRRPEMIGANPNPLP